MRYKVRCGILTGLALILLGMAGIAYGQEDEISAAIAALRSPSESARIEAIDTLGRLQVKTMPVVLAIAELTSDQSALVRAHAVFAISEMREAARAAVPQIIKLVKDPDVRVRRAVVRAIKEIRPGPEVSIPLLLTLMGDTDPAVRLRATDAITDLGQAAVPQLIRALDREPIRYWVILALGQIGPEAKEAVPSLVEIAADEQTPPEVRREAIMSLGQMGEAAVPATKQINAALDNPQLRSAAVYALGNLGPLAKEAKGKLKSFAASDDPFVRTVTAWALVRVAPEDQPQVEKSMQVLADSLKSKDERVRQAAAKALSDLELNPKLTVPAIKDALADADPATVTMALDALAKMGEAGVPTLIEALNYKPARLKAIALLRRLGPAAQPALGALVDLVKTGEPDVRREAIFALADMGPAAKDAVPVLVEVLKTTDTRIRYAAAYALGRIGPAALAAEPTLVALLGSEDKFLALSAAWALARIDPHCELASPSSVPIFIAALSDPDPRTRMEAASSLRCLGPLARPATDELQQALNDENVFVRDMAAEALAAIQGDEPTAVRPAAPPAPPQPAPAPPVAPPAPQLR